MQWCTVLVFIDAYSAYSFIAASRVKFNLTKKYNSSNYLNQPINALTNALNTHTTSTQSSRVNKKD